MATQAELQAAIDDLGNSLAATLAGIEREISQLAAGTPATQAQIDSLKSFTSQLRAATTRL